MTPLEKTYYMRLSYLKGKIQSLVDEWRVEAEESKYPFTKRMRNFYAKELENKLREFSKEANGINYTEIKE